MTETAARTLELLAPAGGFDALRAAVRNGADAVYLGTTELNARRGAENFTLEDLAEACRYAHLRGTKVYLTANVVVLESEMGPALNMIARAWEAGIDAVIVQDLGLLLALRTALPDVRVHGSTQIDVHNAASVRVLADLGVSRVTLARELSVAEIAGLVEQSPVELESFVHGSLCFCHSGQCFMSSMIGGRSANRGLCAQPCRLPYELVDSDGRVADVPGRYLLSPRDLCGIELLPDLVASGVTALKIEGRMKSPEYVASVVTSYRAAIDRALADADSFAVRASETATLEEAFNRGFTKGYLDDIRDDRMMSYQRPNNRGVPVGRVASTSAGHAVIALDRSLESGDTIEFWTGDGRFAQAAGTMEFSGGRSSAAPAGAKVGLAVERPVRPGDRVFRVQNAALTEAARRSWQSAEERRSLPLHMRVRVRIGEPALVEVTGFGVVAKAEGPVVETARTKAVTADEVVEHVSRLGGTPYSVSEVTVQLDAIAGIGFSTLHQLRREAIERLEQQRLRPWAERPKLPADPAPPELPRVAHPGPRGRKDRVSPALVCAVADARAARLCLDAGADAVVLATSFSTNAPNGAGYLLPRVVHEEDMAPVLELAASGVRPVVAGNLGVVAAAAERGVPVQADWGLNVVNPWAASVMDDLGATLLWCSPELSGRQVAAIVERSAVPVGVVVGGRLELMIAEHCIMQAAGECTHECRACPRRRQRWVLRDRKGYDMPVTTDAEGLAHLYNAVPLDLARALPEIVAAGVAAVRLELQSEAAEDAGRLTSAWRERLDLAVDGRLQPDVPIVEPSTSGQFFRGLR
jgi:putative protease